MLRYRSDGPTQQKTAVKSGTVTTTPISVTNGYSNRNYGNKVSVYGTTFTYGIDVVASGTQEVFTSSGAAKAAAVASKLDADLLAQMANKVPPVVQVVTSESFSEMSDVVVESFHSRSAKGELFNNPMAKYEHKVDISPAEWKTRTIVKSTCKVKRSDPFGGYFTVYVTSGSVKDVYSYSTMSVSELPALLAHASAFKPSVTGTALSDAFANVQRSDLDLAMMAAERQKTFAFVVAKIINLKNVIQGKTLKNMGWKQWARGRRLKAADAAQLWLELRYALRPLLIDIENTLKYLDSGPSAVPGGRLTCRGSEHVSSTGSTTLVSSRSYEIDYTFEISARAGVLCEVSKSMGDKRFGFTNWASVAWELIPYSFVVNWVIDVSKLLYTLNPNVNLLPLIAWSGVMSKTSLTARCTVSTPAGPKVMTLVLTGKQKSRSPSSLNQSIAPSIRVNFDAAKAVDLLALTRQLWKR